MNPTRYLVECLGCLNGCLACGLSVENALADESTLLESRAIQIRRKYATDRMAQWRMVSRSKDRRELGSKHHRKVQGTT